MSDFTSDNPLSSDDSQRHKEKTKPFTKKQKAFLAAYSVCGNITQAADSSGCDRVTHYLWMKDHPGYKEAFWHAKETAIDALEKESRRRALEGCRRYKFHNGHPIMVPCPEDFPCAVPYGGSPTGFAFHYFEDEKSDALLIFLMKGHRPEMYKDRFYMEHAGAQGGPIRQQTSNIDLSKLSVELRKAIVKELGLDKEEEEMT